MIAHGTTITFTVIGQTGFWPVSIASVRSDVIDGLTPFFDVQDVSLKTRSFLTDPVNYITEWPYEATVRATVRADYGDIRDVDSIVAHAFYNAGSVLPTVTASGYEQNQIGNQTTGVSLTTALLAVAAVLALLAVVKLT